MSVYRRGAVYWWRRRVTLGRFDKSSIMLRISLKTSDKAEAKRRAAALEMELEMVAVTLPQRSQAPSPEKLCHAYKQALEFKRDQIISIQSRPPFDDEAHRLSNWASSKIFGQIARSGSEPFGKGAWGEFLDDPALSDNERAVLNELCSCHGLQILPWPANR